MYRTVASKPLLLPQGDVQTPLPPTQRRARPVNKKDASADSNPPKNVAQVHDDDGDFYTVDELSRSAGVSRHRIYRAIRDGDIEARLASSGRRKWLIPAHQISPLLHDDPFGPL